MPRKLSVDRSALLAVAAMIVVTSAAAQTCNSLLGDTQCGGGVPGAIDFSTRADGRQGATGFSTQSLGRDLSNPNQMGYFAGITFGGGGAKCSGLFKTRNCSGR